MRFHVLNGPSVRNLAATAGGAAATAAAGPAGTAVGSAVGAALSDILAGLFGGGKSDGSSPEFRDFIRATGGGAFEEWVKQYQPDAIGWKLEQLLPQFYAWLFTTGRSVLWWSNDLNPRGYAYRQGLTEDAYKAMGVDYWKSVANRQAGVQTVDPVTGKWTGWVMLPGGGTPAAPTPAVNRLKRLAGDVGQQLTGAATTAIQQTLQSLTQDAGAAAGAQAAKDLTPYLLGGGALLAFLALRK